jgi:hypothetical protein
MQLTLDIFEDQAILFDPIVSKKRRLEDMSLSMFMSDPGWRAVRDEKATGESKGMYHMLEPDGAKWQGGWIGKFRNEDQAKRDFHHKQLYWAVHRGTDLADFVLSDYPKLLMSQKSIRKKMNEIYIGDGDYIAVEVGNRTRHFHKMDFPMFSRVSMREFIRDHSLVELTPDQPAYGSGPVEEMAIALTMKLDKLLAENHRPHFLFLYRDERLAWGREGVEVRLRIPEEINVQGHCTRYRVVEGKTVFSSGSCCTRIEYQDGDGTVRTGLQPSQLLAIRTASGDWKEVTLL